MDRPTSTATLAAGPVEYRMVPGGQELVVLLHGGHMRAGLSLGEEQVAAAGYSVLLVSRPGYGRTPLSAGPAPTAFAGVLTQLCSHLGFGDVRAVMGISAGGPTAVAFAAAQPDRVHGLVLVSARSALPYPDGVMRAAAPVVFGPSCEAVTWAAVRSVMRSSPDRGLRTMMANLSTAPVRQVIDDLTPADRAELIALFSAMRSGSGFLADLRDPGDVQAERAVRRPTLIVASPHDGGVDPRHAAHLLATIPGATLWPSPSLSHMVWYGSGASVTQNRIVTFLRDLPF
ncbi:MAG: alpha/beta hydrolase [Cellulomonas sp.]|nr:alpha/beta hydrolase [Cellulomonas sp.]